MLYKKNKRTMLSGIKEIFIFLVNYFFKTLKKNIIVFVCSLYYYQSFLTFANHCIIRPKLLKYL